MDEMNQIREFLPDPGGPTMQVTMRAEARLTAEFAQARPQPARRRPAPWRRWRYALLAAGVAGAAAAAVIAPTMLGGDHASQAYAVESMPNGTIKVTLHEFTDAAGLQHKLNAMGVHVAVDYLPLGMRCTEPRATMDYTQRQSEVVEDQTTHAAGRGPARPGDFTFYIHAERIRPGQTLVWTLSFDPKFPTRNHHSPYAVTIQEYLARGPVKPCKPAAFHYAGPSGRSLISDNLVLNQ